MSKAMSQREHTISESQLSIGLTYVGIIEAVGLVPLAPITIPYEEMRLKRP
jgi:hypothetical protein